MTDSFVRLSESPFQGNREQVLIRLCEEVQTPARFTSKILKKLPELPDNATMYDLVNLVTITAREAKRPERLQMRAGHMVKVLTQEENRCDHCGHRLEEQY